MVLSLSVIFVIAGITGFVGGEVTRRLKWRVAYMLPLSCMLPAAAITAILIKDTDFDGMGAIMVIYIPFFALAGAFGGAVGFWVRYDALSSRRRKDTMKCQQCGYSLRGLTGDPIRCPECGMIQQAEPGAES